MPNTARLGILLVVTTAAIAAGPNFQLGIDYTQRIGVGAQSHSPNPIIATDGAGAIYVLDSADPGPGFFGATVLGSFKEASFYVMKLSPAGQIAYVVVLDFQASALAVDSSGGAYVGGPGVIAKLNSNGTGLAYRMILPDNLTVDGLAVDSSGHAYMVGRLPGGSSITTPNAFQQTIPADGHSKGFIARLNPGGTAFEFATYLGGNGWDIPAGIALDGSGGAVVTGYTTSTTFPVTPGAYITTRVQQASESAVSFLTRLSPDGSKLVYSTFLPLGGIQGLAVNQAGSAVVYSRSSRPSLLRLNPEGTAAIFNVQLIAETQSVADRYGRALAIDAAGNTYFTGLSPYAANISIKNNLTPCSGVYLAVLSPSGDVVQTTYVANSAYYASAVLALGPDSTVFVAGTADPAFAPTRTVGNGNGSLFLTRFSPNDDPQLTKLACIGNAASYGPGGVAPGEIVSLFGQNLGPAEGIQPQVDLLSGYPKSLGGVQVMFDQTPAPLLYVQDNQINAIVPWSLSVGQTTQICVTFNGVKTNCLTRLIWAAAPGVFTVDGSHAAALNQDGTLNSAANPAQRGSTVSIFTTGMGPLTTTPQDGSILQSPLPSQTLSARLAYTTGALLGIFPVVIEVQNVSPVLFGVAGLSQIDIPTASLPGSVQVGVGPGTYLGTFSSNPFSVYLK